MMISHWFNAIFQRVDVIPVGFRKTMTEWRPSKVDEALLAAIDRTFAGHAGNDSGIDAVALKRALRLRGDYLAQRVLARFVRDGDGSISRGPAADAALIVADADVPQMPDSVSLALVRSVSLLAGDRRSGP